MQSTKLVDPIHPNHFDLGKKISQYKKAILNFKAIIYYFAN